MVELFRSLYFLSGYLAPWHDYGKIFGVLFCRLAEGDSVFVLGPDDWFVEGKFSPLLLLLMLLLQSCVLV